MIGEAIVLYAGIVFLVKFELFSLVECTMVCIVDGTASVLDEYHTVEGVVGYRLKPCIIRELAQSYILNLLEFEGGLHDARIWLVH